MTDFMTSPFGMDDGASTSAGAGEPHTTLLKSGDIVTQQLMAGISEDRRAALLSELDAGCSASRSAVDTAREAADVAACEAQDAATAADVAAAESTLAERESEAAQRELTAAEAAFVAAERRLAAARIEASRADVVAAEARGRRSAAVATRLQREQEQHERLQAVRRLSEEHAEAQRSAAARLAAEEHARFRAALAAGQKDSAAPLTPCTRGSASRVGGRELCNRGARSAGARDAAATAAASAARDAGRSSLLGGQRHARHGADAVGRRTPI